MKNIVKLTESQLRQIISESVKAIITELDWRTYAKASEKADKIANDKNTNKYEKIRRKQQAEKFHKEGNKRYATQYGLEKYDKIANQMTPRERESHLEGESSGTLKKLQRRHNDMENFYGGKSEYSNGKWRTKE